MHDLLAPSTRRALGVIRGPQSNVLSTVTPSCCTRRHRSTDASKADAQQTSDPLTSRWLSDVKQRIGKCITFGLQPQQVREASTILQEIARDWRELVAGSEGFLTVPHRRGLYRRRVIWGEQDSMGHVNNVLYNRYAETGRVEWAMKYAKYIDPAHGDTWRELVTPKSIGLILKSIKTEYKFPMKYPDHISVYHKIANEPNESTDGFIFDVLIMSEVHQRVAARVTEDCPVYDYRIGKKATLPPFMIEVLRETWRLQEEAKRENTRRVYGLLERVRKLEAESWDREGAVEDMGSTAR